MDTSTLTSTCFWCESESESASTESDSNYDWMDYRDYTASEKTFLKASLKAFNKAMSWATTEVSDSDPFDSGSTVETDRNSEWDFGF